MKTWKEIASMKDYNKYSKATICSHMKRKIDDPVIDKRKQESTTKVNLKSYHSGTNAMLCDKLRFYARITDILQATQDLCWHIHRYFRQRYFSRRDLEIRFKFAKFVRYWILVCGQKVCDFIWMVLTLPTNITLTISR